MFPKNTPLMHICRLDNAKQTLIYVVSSSKRMNLLKYVGLLPLVLECTRSLEHNVLKIVAVPLHEMLEAKA